MARREQKRRRPGPSEQGLVVIAIRPGTRAKLFDLKRGPGDSYDDVILRLLGVEA